MSFRDHFSSCSDEYARFRPAYPEALYRELAGLAPGLDLACDLATGSGHAALGLASHFRFVLATDASPQQLEHARPHARVGYGVAYAEQLPLPDHSLDLITVAAAAHWFDHDRFYPEVRRVLRPAGVLALWSYYMFEIDPDSEAREVEAIVDRLANEIVAPYWPEQMHFNQSHYRDLPFPLERMPFPKFRAVADWTLDQVLGFAATWSATRRYREALGKNPVNEVVAELTRAWGEPERRLRLSWPLHALVGRFDRASEASS